MLLFKMDNFNLPNKILDFSNYRGISVHSRLLEITDIFISPDQSKLIVNAESATIIYDLTNE